MDHSKLVTTVRFAIGDLVHHRLFDYRGVVFDVDESFQGSDAWYESVAKSRPPKDRPWYHVLVDGSDHTTYVAERNLQYDVEQEPIHHPMLGHFFDRFDNGHYLRNQQLN
jgi:heat shock protein HspQ